MVRIALTCLLLCTPVFGSRPLLAQPQNAHSTRVAVIPEPPVAVSAQAPGRFRLAPPRPEDTLPKRGEHEHVSSSTPGAGGPVDEPAWTLVLAGRVSITVPNAPAYLLVDAPVGDPVAVRMGPGALVADLVERRPRICVATGDAEAHGQVVGPGSCIRWTDQGTEIEPAPYPLWETYQAELAGPASFQDPGRADPIDYEELLRMLEKEEAPTVAEGSGESEVSGGAACLDTAGNGGGAGLPDQPGAQVEVEPRPGILQIEIELIRK